MAKKPKKKKGKRKKHAFISTQASVLTNKICYRENYSELSIAFDINTIINVFKKVIKMPYLHSNIVK